MMMMVAKARYCLAAVCLFFMFGTTRGLLLHPLLRPRCSTPPPTINVQASAETHHFKWVFPHVPYELGIRHIHTPEHVTHTHRFGTPFFRITNTTAPRRGKMATAVDFECEMLGSRHNVTMVSLERSHAALYFRKGNKSVMCAHFYVRPLDKGHELKLTATLFQRLPLEARALMAVSVGVNMLEDYVFWAHETPKQDSNLRAYRRMVLTRSTGDPS